MYFTVFSRKKAFRYRQWYWNLRAPNHEIVAQGEGYRNKEDCYRAIHLVQDTTIRTEIREGL